jgi:hypothetical protein
MKGTDKNLISIVSESVVNNIKKLISFKKIYPLIYVTVFFFEMKSMYNNYNNSIYSVTLQRKWDIY